MTPKPRLETLMCRRLLVAVLVATAAAWLPPVSRAQSRALDPERSTVSIRVFRAGVLSFMGDDHRIEGPIYEGVLDEARQTVSVKIKARNLKVLDPNLSPDRRKEVQQRMLGPDVLDADRYPDIEFRSTRVRREGGQTIVDGLLSLHGKEQPVAVRASQADGVYRGTASLKQTRFGIKPVTVAAGTVRVKDEVRIEFTAVAK